MESADNLKAGTDIGGYRVLARLGQGAMAVLYRVASPSGDENCVLKMPKLGFGSDPACYAGFDGERMILERLAGPHVPQLRAAGEHDFGPYLVIEHVAGTSLAVHVRGAPLPAVDVARLGAALAVAVHDLHRQDVVHHDLKPSHVILRDDGGATLIDFGLAFHSHLPDLVDAEASRPLGTPAYISPEQLAGVRGDPRSDLFAVGVILYLLATGRLPFGEPSSNTGVRRRLYFDPVPPRRICPDLPPWLQEVILHCLEINADERYATAAQLAHDLTHPDQVALTERGNRTRRDRLPKIAKRILRALIRPSRSGTLPAEQLALAPHVLVAVDTTGRSEALFRALRTQVQRLIAGEPSWRVSCVSVLERSVLTDQDEGDEITRSLRTQRLVELHHWAQPLGLPAEHLRFHVLEGADTANRLVEHARANHVDHIIMGARDRSGLRRLLGSVSTRVAAEAPCTVTVVRARVSTETKTAD